MLVHAYVFIRVSSFAFQLTQCVRLCFVSYATIYDESDDVERAVDKLDVLGSGFRIVDLGRERVVQSVPVELSVDHTKALSACGEYGYTSASALQALTGWDDNRTNATLRFLLDNEIAWLDLQSPEPTYWILGLVAGSTSQA